MDRTKNIVGDDGVLRSPRSDDHLNLTPVEGSFYIELIQSLNKRIKSKGDWTWMKNCLTNEILMGSDVEKITKRYILLVY